MSALFITLALLFIIGGAMGTVYPSLPGLPLMFVGIVLLGYSDDFTVIGSGTLWFAGILAALGWIIDFIVGVLGAKYTGASKTALYGSFIGGIVGMFFGLFGILLGPLLGAASGELLARRNLFLAGKVGIGTFIGFIVGTAAKIGTALVMILILVWQYATHYLW